MRKVGETPLRGAKPCGFAGVSALALALASCAGGDGAGEPANVDATEPQVQVALDPGDRVVLFGDLHLHTSYSLDAAGEFGVETLPDDAYRFAKGEAVEYNGQMVRRHAPLDFLAVTDHAEYLGNVRLAARGELDLPRYILSKIGFKAPPEDPFANPSLAGLMGEDVAGLNDPALVQGHWMDIVDAAQRHNQPGRFTALVGFEYSPTFLDTGTSLHRNVIFRGPNYPVVPFGATDSMHPEALWAYAESNRAAGIDSLMIPHNPNLSGGASFALEDSYGEPIGPEYAELRRRNEPLAEITQKKGTSETRPELSPDDPFADFEPYGNTSNPKVGSYLRPALMRGMELAEITGLNPYEFGFVGASDYHSGISASEEDNFPGALGTSDDQANPARVLYRQDPLFGGTLAVLGASGITGVWADANTREAIFDALRRRETFATSGPRMRVRMFGGWNDPSSFAHGADWAREAYRWGVPMGGLLPAMAARSEPNFVVQAVKDPLSGNLDRAQIVKLWREGGQSHEKIYDVAWSDGRAIRADGSLEPVGNMVDTATATWTNDIGSEELFATWADPDFDPSQQAIYYARVLEIPTPRWSTYLAVRNNMALTDSTPSSLQERAWTSPIFYRPQASGS